MGRMESKTKRFSGHDSSYLYDETVETFILDESRRTSAHLHAHFGTSETEEVYNS